MVSRPSQRQLYYSPYWTSIVIDVQVTTMIILIAIACLLIVGLCCNCSLPREPRTTSNNPYTYCRVTLWRQASRLLYLWC